MTTRHLNARLRGRIPTAASVRWRASRQRRQVALTFDDGPDATGTEAILEVLDGAAARATFFVVGDRAAANRLLLATIADAGHEIGLHADRHERLDRLPAAAIATRLRDARARLEDIGQTVVTLHRPPFGRVSLAGLRGAARAGLRVLLWNADPMDFRPTPRSELAQRLRDSLHAGTVMLLHDGATTFEGQGRATAVALGDVIDVIAERELVTCTGSELW